MRRVLLLCLLIFLPFATRLPAQGILPASIAGWDATSTSPNAEASPNFDQIAGPSAATLKEYGAEDAEARTYTHGADSFKATVYTFKDTAGAYGAYSFLRTSDMAPAKLTQHSSMSRDRALALTGNLVVEFTGKELRRAADPIELLVAVAGGRAHFGAYPTLPQRLPPEDFVPRSDHYILGPVALAQYLPLAQGDWLGLSMGAQAELAHYRLNGHDATLVVVDYPTPQIAAAQLEKLKTQLGVAVSGSAKNQAASSSSSNQPPRLYAQRDSTVLALISGAPSLRAANSVLAQVHSGLVLTWNEPVLNANQPSMPVIILGTIIGAGEICAFTLLGGVLFAGIRLLLKRVLPGRIFDRAWDLEIIELGLSSRPIKGNDLYQMRRPPDCAG